MKKLLLFNKLLPSFACLLLLSACGGGGGGSNTTSVAPVLLAKGTFKKVATPAAGFGQWIGGVIGGSGVQRSQTLLLASDIKASGVISRLNYVLYANFAGTTCNNVTISLSHVPATTTSLSTTFASNLNLGTGAPVTVLNAASMTFPAGNANANYPISIDPVFTYNGVDNLLIDIVSGPCTGAGGPQLTATNTTGSIRVVTQNTTNTNGVLPAGDNRDPVMTVGFTGGENQHLFGTNVGNLTFTSTATPKVQFLYKATDINGSGPITGLAFQTASGISATTTVTYSIRMAHTSLTGLSTGGIWDDSITGSVATVANNVTVKLPAGIPAGGWFWIPLPSETFNYNGTDNLLIEVDNISADNTINLYGGTASGVSVYNLDNTATGPSTVYGFVPNIRLRFNGAPTQVMPVKTTDSSVDITSGSYPMYVSSWLAPWEIGNKGSIKGMACRLDANASAGTYQNLTVKIDNSYGNAVTVYNGNFTLNASLTKGDWFEIPFSTSYSYNGTDTLKFYITWSNATGIVTCDAGEDTTLYPLRTATGDASASPMTLTYLNGLPTLKLNITR